MDKGNNIDISALERKIKKILSEDRWKEAFGEIKVWFEEKAIKELRFGDFVINYKRDDKDAVNTAITAKIEEKSKEYICPRIPGWMGPDHLTMIGLFGMILVAVSFGLGFFNKYYLVGIVLGLIINWFGDSFDGSIARYRNKTRPRYGYYMDKIIDSVAVLIVALGMGLSGFVKIEIALLFACVYFILMFQVDLVTHVQGITKNSFGLVGPTEIRILGIGAAIYMYLADVFYVDIYGHYLTQYDISILSLSGIMFLIALVSIANKGIELDKLDRANW